MDKRAPAGLGTETAPGGIGPVQSSEVAFASLPIGADLRDYRIQKILGQGGFGITYLAEHASLKKHVAIKEYFPQQFATRDTATRRVSATNGNMFRWGLDRFVKEAEFLARFRHRGIVDVTDHFEENGTAYMVLAYEGGRSLGGWLQDLERRPTQTEIDTILDPLLDAVAFVHDKNLVHRDIAPDNILIREDGSPVLIDFGAARAALNDHAQSMTAIVKDNFSPEEQYQSEGYLQGPWGDIYSIGAILYMMVTGNKPIPATQRRTIPGAMSAMNDAASGGYRRSFLEAIDWALKMAPHERPQSIAAWRGPLLDKLEVPIGNPSATAPVKPLVTTAFSQLPGPPKLTTDRISEQRRRTMALIGVPVAAALAGFAMFKMLSPGSSTTGTNGIQVRLELPKTNFAIGDAFNFAVTANRDCHFLVYTISADDKVEVHDPNFSGAFMGPPILKAGERRAIPVAGAPGVARINPPGGAYEIGAVCGRDELTRLGLSGAQLKEPSRSGKRSFSFAVDKIVSQIKRDEIGRSVVGYQVK